MEDAAQPFDGMATALAGFALEPVLPGAVLFVLLGWLSQRFVRHGFGSVRQHGLAPASPALVRASREVRRWWPCACAAEACACFATLVAVRDRIDRACGRAAQRCAVMLRAYVPARPAASEVPGLRG